jgi:D-glycero-alpha-D-manno-heptose 1-phosphate guanylyltransferase
MEAIILAGGFGTRLKSVVSDIPKPMAPVNEKPFLCYLLDYLKKNDVNKVILSVGYKYKKIVDYFGFKYKDIILEYAIEEEPLGTGGAIKKAVSNVKQENVFVLNGDTFFNISLHSLHRIHISYNSDLTISLKPMKNYDRYGSVICRNNKVVGFEEKHFKKAGDINGGIYILKTSVLLNLDMPAKFSFESDFMEKKVRELKMFAYKTDQYFIDIGIPEDYEKARKELLTIL